MAPLDRATADTRTITAIARAAVAALVLVCAGCSYGITVKPSGGPDLFAAWRASVGHSDELSPRTLQSLRRWDLDQSYERQPHETYTKLQMLAAKDSDPELLFALAEISFLLGRKAEKKSDPGACGYYYLCAGYAYHYLFPHCPTEGANPTTLDCERCARRVDCGQGTFDSFAFDPRFRLACDLYNAGLTKCIGAAQKIGRLDPRQQLQLPTADGKGFTLSVMHHGFPWQPEEFGPLHFCSEYEVVGLANSYRGFGLGVSLIGIRVGDESAKRKSVEKFPHEVSFPVTAFFRFDGTVADLATKRAGRLELYNPLAVEAVRIGRRRVPLETDLTTPLAYFLSRTDLEGIEYEGLFRGDKIQDRAGIYMFEPYQPGKIPVIMVHGLFASPLTWTTMFNDLRADAFVREHFQFWFYLYPTGSPYIATAADLRRELAKLRGDIDPHHQDPALEHLVLVGHSMGGLVSRLLTVDSGQDFWKLVSSRSFEEIKVTSTTKNELHDIFFFDQQPYVERVVFIGTPHHGSTLSPSAPAQLMARFIRLPKKIMHAASDLARIDPERAAGAGPFANSIDLLAPESPALELLAARPQSRNVHMHSIIGQAYGKGDDSTDGVVPYKSAHLDGVESEVVVPATHSYIHHQPRAVLEVRRILIEHLQNVRKAENLPLLPAAQLETTPKP